MLQINMADVMNVIGSLTPYLIAIGVLFALALIITFAVNKKTVKEVATRKIVHSESWLVALVGIVVAVSMMLTGPLSTLLNNATTTKYMLSDTTVSKANELAKEVQSEAITMLKKRRFQPAAVQQEGQRVRLGLHQPGLRRHRLRLHVRPVRDRFHA